jgi:hypothetical protein
MFFIHFLSFFSWEIFPYFLASSFVRALQFSHYYAKRTGVFGIYYRSFTGEGHL